MNLVNKQLGKNVMRMASDPSLEVTYLSTGLLPIDIALGGGIPTGRFTEFYGDWSTLKSYIGYKWLATQQAEGKVCGLLDTERVFDPEWARQLGVNTDELLVWPNPETREVHTGEEAIDAAQVMVANGVDCLVFDSVSAALPQQEDSKRLSGESVQPARLAQLMSLACRKLTATNDSTAMLWINQTRMNIGVTFGNPEVTTGGRALPYYASLRLNLRKTGVLREPVKQYDGEKWINSKKTVAQKYAAIRVKSKLSKPFTDVHFVWDLQEAMVDEVGFLIAQGIELGLIDQRGSSWSFAGLKVVGREKFRQRMQATPGALAALEDQVRTYHGLPVLSVGQPARRKKKVVATTRQLRRK